MTREGEADTIFYAHGSLLPWLLQVEEAMLSLVMGAEVEEATKRKEAGAGEASCHRPYCWARN